MSQYRVIVPFLPLFLVIILSGCGKQETVLPTDPFSEEQKAAIKAEDAAVADEESAGYVPPPGKKKK